MIGPLHEGPTTMLLTITTTHRPATDLGYLLHKNPANVRTVGLGFGDAHVLYPEATDERCTAALVLEVDPVALVRGKDRPDGGPGGGPGAFALAGYVNDRPYVASSFVSVALGKLFGTAMGGRSADRPELAATPLPLEVRVPVLPCRGGPDLLDRLFGPLGYEVAATPIALDPALPDWGPSGYVDAVIGGTVRLADLLTHLYVLLPVLDDDKHYWVGADEIDKLLARGGGWLPTHPERDLIVRRYLRHRRHLADDALARLVDPGDAADADTGDATDADADGAEAGADRAEAGADGAGAEPGRVTPAPAGDEAAVEAPLRLNDRRVAAVVAALTGAGARRVVDVGCGDGRLVAALLAEPTITEVVGTDVSPRALSAAARRLHLDELSDRQAARLTLVRSSATYRDRRLAGYDAMALVEVVEHVDRDRLPALERAVFGAARPTTVVVTTPNAEHNVRFGLPPGTFRHRDHRFEWTRAEFHAWAGSVAAAYGYAVRYHPVGDDDAEVGPPTQMAVLAR
jgi:SAM-dependent methyltransferase